MIRRARSVVPSLALVALVVVPALRASEVPFSNETPIDTALNFARSVASADFDRDGDLDLVGVASLDNAIAWWENTAGDGSAWTRSDLSLALTNVRDVAVGDLDGDGDSDVVATSFSGSVVAWWENDLGSLAVCGFDFCAHTVGGVSDPDALELADLDGDGDLDVVVAGRGSDLIRWFANPGNGSGWGEGEDIATGFDGAQVLWIADLDGDGDLDVLGGAGEGTGEFAWWENDLGSGAACGGDWCEHSLDTGATAGVSAADLDGDGDLDLLRSENGAVAWWENELGDGSSWTETTISTTRGRNGLAAIDLDGDGDLDVVGLDSGGWIENLAGDASSWVERSMPGTPSDCFDDLDAVAARSSADRLVWWRNETLHRSAAYSSGGDIGSTLTHVGTLVTANLDGDGDDDIAATSESGVLRWSESDGTPGDGGWIDHTIYTGTGLAGVTAADFDGDGDIDLAVCDFLANALIWFENDGTPADGGWTSHSVSALLTAIVVTAEDLDGDGDLDLVASSRDGALVSWFENDGTPADGEWTAREVIPGLDFVVGVATADLDGDGDLDVLAAAANSDSIVWAESDGTPGDGGWSLHAVTSSFNGATAMAPCDLDRDGDLDLVAVGQDAKKVVWFENDGTPADAEWSSQVIQASYNRPYTAQCADLDGDGDLDVASTAFVQNLVTVWLSDGSPGDGGWQRVDVATAFNGASDVVVSDLDRDGKLDLVATALNANRVRWWHNGGGQFALPTADAVAAAAPNPGATDVLVLDIGGAHLGRSGDADAELATLELAFDDGSGTALAGSELDSLVDTVRLYLDDGDGIFEPDTDDTNFFSQGSPFSLDLGVLELTMVDGDPSVQVPYGSAATWWLALDLSAGAATATPDAFRVTHVTNPASSVGTSTGEMSTTDVPLDLEEQSDVTSSLVEVNHPPTLDAPIGDDATHAGAAYSYEVGGFFSDPEGGMLSFDAGGLPASLSASSSGVITGTPTVAEAAGSPYSVTVTATDQGGLTAMGSFELTILSGGTIVVDGTCTLTDAILSANTDTNTGSCVGAGGVETIVLDVDVTLTAADTTNSTSVESASAGLPDVATEMRIEGGLGSTIARDASLTCLEDGVGRFRLFNVVAGGGLTLAGVTLENGCAPRGGAVVVKGAGASLAAIDSTFRANAAQGVTGIQLTAEGGAVWIGTDAELTLNGCLFDGNGARGSSAGGGFGGAISARSGTISVSITGTDFVGNEAVGGSNPLIGGEGRGGAIASERALDLSDAILTDNVAQGGSGSAIGGAGTAGAIYVSANDLSQVDRAVFAGNLAVGGDSSGLGGQGSGGSLQASAVVTDTAIIGGGAFGGDGDHGGEAAGGGLRVEGQLVRVTVASTRAQGGAGATDIGGTASGGALYSEGPLDLLDVTLSGGLAEGGSSVSGAGGGATGGGWHEADENDGAVTVRHLTAVDNAAIGGEGATAGVAAGGGAWLSRGGIEVTSSLLVHGWIAPGGGASTPDDCQAVNAIDSLGYNVVEAPGTCVFAAAGDQTTVDPGVSPLGRYGCATPLPDGGCLPVHAIHIDGAAVDHGSCTVSGATADARGLARPFDVSGVANADDGCDAGAYEVQDANGNGIDDGFEIFADGFETGDTSGWSAAVP